MLDDLGGMVQCIQTTNPEEKSSMYQTITMPNNLKCDWKEKIFLDLLLDIDWRSLHLCFKLYKHEVGAVKRRLYGFSFLPLKNEKDTLVCDGQKELLVFQVQKEREPLVQDYLSLNLFRHDSTIKKSKLNGKGFAATNDKLVVETRLISTQMSNQLAVFDLLNADLETGSDFDDILWRYTVKKDHLDVSDLDVQESRQSKSKRILFIIPILEMLWKIATHFPTLEHKVFDAFIATIHPIKTDSDNFGYAGEYFEKYINSEFRCPEIYEMFVNAFTKMIKNIENIEAGDEFETSKMMCIPLIFRLIVRAYHVKKDSTGQCDAQNFINLTKAIGDFLRGPVKSVIRKHTFLAFFEVETINLVSELAPGALVVDILKDIVEKDNEQNKDLSSAQLFNAVRSILCSQIYQEAENQETVFHLALSSIPEQMSKLASGFAGARGFVKELYFNIDECILFSSCICNSQPFCLYVFMSLC